MATIGTTKTKNGKCRYKILFFLDGKRKSLSLGSKYTAKQVERIKTAVEEIAAAIETGGKVGKATAGFLADMTDDLRARFIACGLLEEPRCANISALWKDFLREVGRGRKAGTADYYEAVSKRFLAYFPGTDSPGKITREDAERWKSHLKREGYAGATISNSLTGATSLFNWAVNEGIVEVNPFKGIRKPPLSNDEKLVYIPMDWYNRLLDACSYQEHPQEWRTLLAFCRIGGLRCPSETSLLTWRDVDWENGSVRVRSPKTEHHAGKGERIIPMYESLKAQLNALWDAGKEGDSPYLLPHVREITNIGRAFKRVILNAGLKPWRSVFQNLRVSASNDVAKEYGWTAEGKWVGHSNETARRHYFTVTDAEFQRAVYGASPDSGAVVADCGNIPSCSR